MAIDEPVPMPEDAADSAMIASTASWNSLLTADAETLETLLADELTFHCP